MKNNFIGEILISILLIGLLIFFINPIDLLMPHMLHPFMIPFLTVLFIIFTGLFWKESPGDERTQLHKFIAGRYAYLALTSTLIFGVIYQSFTGEVDPFLVIGLCTAFLTKIIGLIYVNTKH